MAIEYNKRSEIGVSTVKVPQGDSTIPDRKSHQKKATVTAGETAHSFINTTNHGLKVKMPDSVHIFLPGETIEFIPKELGEDGADRELARRARRAEMKSKASMDWAKRNKGK